MVFSELQLMNDRPAGRALLPQATRNVFFLLTESRVIGTPEKFGNVIVFRSRLNHAINITTAGHLARFFFMGWLAAGLTKNEVGRGLRRRRSPDERHQHAGSETTRSG